jgi:hypothetical protein
LWTKGRSASDLSVSKSVILLACLIASRGTRNGQLLSQKDPAVTRVASLKGELILAGLKLDYFPPAWNRLVASSTAGL